MQLSVYAKVKITEIFEFLILSIKWKAFEICSIELTVTLKCHPMLAKLALFRWWAG